MSRTQQVFHALADPTRRQLIEFLIQEGGKTATELAEDLPITRQGVAKHLNILLEANLVSAHQEGRERRYTATPDPLDDAAAWITSVGALWDERLARIRKLVEDNIE